jgi:hypothetical protein
VENTDVEKNWVEKAKMVGVEAETANYDTSQSEAFFESLALADLLWP